MRENLHKTTASAPGTLMLMGEHAVLHGHRALCAAVDPRIAVSLHPRQDQRLRIVSALGERETDLKSLVPSPPFAFVMEAVRRSGIRRGLTLDIQSGFSAEIGFGSSAAVTVATVAALRAARGEPLDRAAIFEASREVLHAVQGRGSGADLAATTYGGIVLYRAKPLEIEPFVRHLPLSAHYVGYKTPTAEVIRIIDQLWAGKEDEREALFLEMDGWVAEAAHALRQGDLQILAHLFRAHHRKQAELGCSDERSEQLRAALEAHDGVLAAKISGSGRGDCLLALGNPAATIPGFQTYPVNITDQGVKLAETS